MTDIISSGLDDLQPDPPADTLKRRFFAHMPQIDAALDRGVRWEKILAHLAAKGLKISPELAASYASQYRAAHGSTRTKKSHAEKRAASSQAPRVSEERRSDGDRLDDARAQTSSGGSSNQLPLNRKRLKPSPTAR